jgi:tetratricopeptide (TPR) repeat protein
VYGHRPAYHGGWYHGDWYGPWRYPGGYRPIGWYWGGGWGWGGAWGLGTGLAVGITLGSPWGWGYYPYYNPYWVPVGGVTYINYSQPIVVAPPIASQVVAASPTAQSGMTDAQQKALANFDIARELFRRGDYSVALAEINRAIALEPNDTLMHEFRALCLFAMQDYQQSAAAIYAVLSIGPGWDWATVSGLYPDTNVYLQQLRALEAYRNANPETAPVRFLLAYHYLLRGNNEAAATEFEIVVSLQPKDQLSVQLLKGLRNPLPEQTPAGPALALPGPAPALPGPTAAPIDRAKLLGNWKAGRDDGSKFALTLTQDDKFHWKHTQQGQDQELEGTFTLANNYLILSASDQNTLVGQVAMEPGDKLKFKLAGGASSDPGLTFTR